jgi:hypothetical protein
MHPGPVRKTYGAGDGIDANDLGVMLTIKARVAINTRKLVYVNRPRSLDVLIVPSFV